MASKNKLGHIGAIPVVPMLPLAAQVNSWGNLHLRLMGDSYVTGSLRGAITPARFKVVKAAIDAQPKEPTYSGSGTKYHALTIVPDPGGKTCDLMAGETKLCAIVIDPEFQIISTDESIADQIEGGADPEEDDEDEDDDANDE